MRKTICILLCLALMLGILGACGSTAASSAASADTEQASASAAESAATENGQPETAAEPADVSESSAAEPEDSAEPEEASGEIESMNTYHELPLTDEDVTFTMFEGMNPNLMSFIDTYSETAIFKWLEETTGVHVEVPQVHPATQDEQFALMVASGDFTDFVSNMTLYTGGFEGALADEVIFDLREFEDKMPLFFHAIDMYEDSARDCRLDNGAVVNTVMMYYGDYDKYMVGPMIRTDWLNELGMDLPRTYDEYYDVLTAFKNNYDAVAWFSGSGSPFLANGYNIRAGYSWGWVTGLDCFYQVDGKIQCGFLEDSFRDYLAMMQKWYSEGLIYQDFFTTNNSYVHNMNDSFTDAVNGKYGIFMEEASVMITYRDYDLEIGGTYIPVKEVGDQSHVASGNSRVNLAKYTISTNCSDPELAAEWLDMWYSKEATVVVNWGTEGETFEYDENGNPHFTDFITNNPDGMTQSTARDIYTSPTGGFLDDNRRYTSLFGDAEYEAMDLWNEGMDDAYDLSTFMTMTTQESSEYNGLAGDMTTLVSTELAKFITGEKNTDSDLDAFVQTLKDMGIERCIEIEQAAYDRYISREIN